ncbi:MAG: protein kinase domain-containing protein [Acidobacteriota bacterium]
MPLAFGTRLGPYEVTAKLGEGGMGEVWRATDTRLKRDVAIKVLPAAFTQDAERLARFEREAQLLAQLHHPNIASIFGLEESDGARALVMELVDGPTLADRMTQGRLPVEDALAIARQMTEALEAAHEKGIVHRDLKPANVKLAADGKVKVLDFGLAKAMDPTPGATGSPSASPTIMNSPTLTAAGTQLGVILGTAAYMSPEQAKGLPVDKRADIWAFGVVLYEMLTGERLFAGDSVPETLAGVLKTEIDLAKLPAATPSAVHRLLRRCLERNPKNRLHDIADARIDLADVEKRGDGDDAAAAATAVASSRRFLPWALAAALAAALVILALWGLRRSGAGAPQVARLSIALPAGLSLDAETAAQTQVLALSPDGRRVVFRGRENGRSMLYLRDLARTEVAPVPGTDDAFEPTFSPDGGWIAFVAGGKLKKLALGGGTPIELADASGSRGVAWGPDGTIVFAPSVNSGLFTIPATGGAAKALTTLDEAAGERSDRWPEILPNGKTVLFTVGTRDKPGDYDDARIDAVSLATGKRSTVFRGARFARVARSSELLLARRTDLLAVPFDAVRAEIRGTPEPVLQGLGGDPRSGVAFVAVAANGSLAAVFGLQSSEASEIVWIDRTGKRSPTRIPPGEFSAPALSPDGRRLAIVEGLGGGARSDLWIADLEHGDQFQLTANGNAGSAGWSPDGKSLVFSTTNGDSLLRQPADGRGAPEVLCRFAETVPIGVNSFTPDGSAVLITRFGLPTRADISSVSLTGAHAVHPLLASAANEQDAVVSPDGRWIAYSGQYDRGAQIYVQPYPSLAGRWQVSRNGGEQPRWSHDGTELFFLAGTALYAAPVHLSPTFSYGEPQRLFDAAAAGPSEYLGNYDVAPDGKRFLFVIRQTAAQQTQPRIDVILNWTQHLLEGAR